MSSVLEFKIVDFWAVMIWYFSHRQRLHRFVLGEYGCACLMILHLIVCVVPSSLSAQMCLLSSVW